MIARIYPLRRLICLLVSVDTHLLVLAGLSFDVPARSQEAKPLEVSLLHLPAPASQTGNAANRARRAVPPTRRRTPGPRVTMRVSRSRLSAPGLQKPAAPVPFPKRPTALALQVSARPGESLASGQAFAPVTGDPTALRGDSGQSFELEDRLPGGDTRPLVEIIQARIDAVAPLVLASSRTCFRARGRAQVLFTISPAGYHRSHRVTGTAPSPCQEERIAAILHLAEPFPFVTGWVAVTVPLTL